MDELHAGEGGVVEAADLVRVRVLLCSAPDRSQADYLVLFMQSVLII